METPDGLVDLGHMLQRTKILQSRTQAQQRVHCSETVSIAGGGTTAKQHWMGSLVMVLSTFHHGHDTSSPAEAAFRDDTDDISYGIQRQTRQTQIVDI